MDINFEDLYRTLDILKKRKLIDMSGIERYQWYKYEKKSQLPSPIIYRIAEKDRRILDLMPYDFLFYTSYTVKVNMAYHNIGIRKLAKHLQQSPQRVYGILSRFNLCYEDKDGLLDAFQNDLIVPLIKYPGGYKLMTAIDTYPGEVNFIERLLIPVSVINDNNSNIENSFNRAISHMYTRHCISEMNGIKDFVDLEKECDKFMAPVTAVATRYNSVEKRFYIAEVKDK